jgi:hypothetical protein
MIIIQTLLETSAVNVWVANIATGTMILGVLGYFLKKFVSDNEARHKSASDRIAAVDARSSNIEKNYIRRFEEIKEKTNQDKEEIINRIGERIQAMEREGSQHRENQQRWMGTIETKVEGIARQCDEWNRNRGGQSRNR